MNTEKPNLEPVKREEPKRKPPPLKVVALRLRYRLEDTNPGD